METVELLEQACADAWPAMVDQPLGQWRMRAAGGFTGRANSTLVVGRPDRSVPAALRAAGEFATRHDIPPKAQVPMGTAAESALLDAGWRVAERHSSPAGVLVMTGPCAALAGPVPAAASVAESPPDDWWPLALDSAALGTAGPSPAQRHVLSTGRNVGFGVVRRAGAAVAVVRGAVVGDLLHISRLAVLPECRRTGLARQLLAATAAWAGRLGAVRYVLQVVGDNAPAIALYRNLGATEHHRYRYWIPAAAESRLTAG